MKTRTLLIAAVMLVSLSAAAFGQAIYSVSSTPVTTVIATGNAELTGNITFTNTTGALSLAGTISLQYGGTNVNITSLFSGITVTGPAAVDTTASVYSPGLLVLDVTAGSAAPITISGVRVQINGTGLTNLVATISATNNLIAAGNTAVTVINSTTGAGIAPSGVASYLSTVPLLTSATAGAPVINTVTGLLSGGNTTIRVQEGFLAAMTKGVGVRITVSATPPKGVTFSFPMTAATYDTTGTAAAINPNWVLGNSTSEAQATAAQVISSSSTSSSSLQAFYYIGTDTVADATNIEYLEIPVTISSTPGSETLPLPAVNFTYTVSLAPVQSPYGSNGTPSGQLAPRFAALEVGPANLLTYAGSQTNLIMPYATAGGGFDSGIAISNTTKDPGTTILGMTGAVPQTGPITFYFYPQNTSTAAFSYVTGATSPGSGLVAGSLPTGATYVVLLSQLLAAAGQPATFAGYIIAVTNFTDAYGIYTVSNFTTLSAYSTVMPFIVAR